MEIHIVRGLAWSPGKPSSILMEKENIMKSNKKLSNSSKLTKEAKRSQ